MSTYAEFTREFEKRIVERVSELSERLANGAPATLEAYRELVGEVRGLRTAFDMIEDVKKHVDERTLRA